MYYWLNWTFNAYAVQPTSNRTRMKWKLISSIKFVVQIIQHNKQYKVTYHKCKMSNEGMENKIITENKHFCAYFLILNKFIQFCTPTFSSGLCLIHYYHYQPS